MPEYTILSEENKENSATLRKGAQSFILSLDQFPALNRNDDDLQFILDELEKLTKSDVERNLAQTNAAELERMFILGMLAVEKRLPILQNATFPIHRKNRRMVRLLQKLLESLANSLFAALVDPATAGIREQHPSADLLLWRTLKVLSLHLQTSYLSASPAGPGIWLQLHRAYTLALEMGVAEQTPRGASTSPQNLYYATVLLGCAQPASFTSREIAFIAEYLELFSDQTDPGQDSCADSSNCFWVNTLQDSQAEACARKSPPAKTVVHYFYCDRIAALLDNQLDSLETGMLPAQLGLPDIAGTPLGRGVMRRLISYWGEPSKRRFPRRRQNYRAVLCVGLNQLWQMFRGKDPSQAPTSSWMIINESPDGYAIMHVAGTIGTLAVGDIAAIRTETSENWQICIVRWALSENQEHIEIGLQSLATCAIPALVAQPGESNSGLQPVLVLPAIPPLRTSDILVTPPGILDKQPERIVLMIENGNLELREVRNTWQKEQNSQIEAFAIEAELRPF